MSPTRESREREWIRKCLRRPGRYWRLGARHGDAAIGIKNRAYFRELRVGGWLHVRGWIDGRRWWIRGGDARFSVQLHDDAAVTVDIERGHYGEVCGETMFPGDPLLEAEPQHLNEILAADAAGRPLPVETGGPLDPNGPGGRWMLSARHRGGYLVFSNRGVFDEFVLDHWLHIEWMNGSQWWMCVGDARVFLDVHGDGTAGTANVYVERGAHGDTRGATTTRGRTSI